MTQAHTPGINARYWTAILLASLCGTNLGDLYAHESGLGIGLGLALLAALTAAVFGWERADRGRREIFYWAVILLIRTGATNIADALAYRVRVPALLLVLTLVALYLVCASYTQSNSADIQHAGDAVPKTTTAYWLSMLAAGVLGTVLGDLCEDAAGHGGAALGLTLLLLTVLAVARGRAARDIVWYWAIVAVARTAGTALGDLLSESKELHMGVWLSTALSAAAFMAVLSLWPRRSAGAKLVADPAAAMAA